VKRRDVQTGDPADTAPTPSSAGGVAESSCPDAPPLRPEPEKARGNRSELYGVNGQVREMADLFYRAKAISNDTQHSAGVRVKAVDTAVKVLNAIRAVVNEREEIQSIQDGEQRLAEIQSALAKARGFAGRKDVAKTPPPVADQRADK
jgi:hypothetical protein